MPSGGIASMIVDGRTGFLVSETQAFVEALTKLIRDPDLRKSVGTAAQQHIAAEFTLPRFYERMDALYGELQGYCDPAGVAQDPITGIQRAPGDPAARS
jgi:glycosyltransferase involved in cell wall biosynthesis